MPNNLTYFLRDSAVLRYWAQGLLVRVQEHSQIFSKLRTEWAQLESATSSLHHFFQEEERVLAEVDPLLTELIALRLELLFQELERLRNLLVE